MNPTIPAEVLLSLKHRFNVTPEGDSVPAATTETTVTAAATAKSPSTAPPTEKKAKVPTKKKTKFSPSDISNLLTHIENNGPKDWAAAAKFLSDQNPEGKVFTEKACSEKYNTKLKHLDSIASLAKSVATSIPWTLEDDEALSYGVNDLNFMGKWADLSRRAKAGDPSDAKLHRLSNRTPKQLLKRWKRLDELDFVNTGKRPRLKRKLEGDEQGNKSSGGGDRDGGSSASGGGGGGGGGGVAKKLKTLNAEFNSAFTSDSDAEGAEGIKVGVGKSGKVQIMSDERTNNFAENVAADIVNQMQRGSDNRSCCTESESNGNGGIGVGIEINERSSDNEGGRSPSENRPSFSSLDSRPPLRPTKPKHIISAKHVLAAIANDTTLRTALLTGGYGEKKRLSHEECMQVFSRTLASAAILSKKGGENEQEEEEDDDRDSK